MIDNRASAYLIMPIFVALLAPGGAKKILDSARNIHRV